MGSCNKEEQTGAMSVAWLRGDTGEHSGYGLYCLGPALDSLWERHENWEIRTGDLVLCTAQSRMPEAVTEACLTVVTPGVLSAGRLDVLLARF